MEPRTFYLDFSGRNFFLKIVVFKIRTLKFAKVQSFKQKERNVNLEPKNVYLSLFKLDFEKV